MLDYQTNRSRGNLFSSITELGLDFKGKIIYNNQRDVSCVRKWHVQYMQLVLRITHCDVFPPSFEGVFLFFTELSRA